MLYWSQFIHFLPNAELLSVYHAILSSHLTYVCQTWGQRVSSSLNKIKKQQDNAMRIISFAKYNARVYVRADVIYKQNKVLKLADHIFMLNCLFAHQQLTNKLPEAFRKYFTLRKDIHSYETRGSVRGEIFAPARKTCKFGDNSITQKSTKDWNLFLSMYPKVDPMKMSMRE